MYQIDVDDRLAGRMIRSILQSELKVSSRLLKTLIRDQAIRCNDKVVYVTARVKPGDVLTVTLPRETPHIRSERLKLDIRYEDAEVIVVNKPAGILTHPSARERFGSMLAGVQAYLTRYHQVPHSVHRLDRDTSGLVMFAKHAHAHHLYDLALRAGDMHRTYCALVTLSETAPNEAARDDDSTAWKTIDLPIALDPDQYSKRTVDAEGKPAVTHYRVVARADGIGLALIVLETGRTHQIRLHFASIGMHVVGDPHYRKSQDDRLLVGQPAAEALMDRQALHALRLTWRHPISKAVRHAYADPPHDITSAWQKMGGDTDIWSMLARDTSSLERINIR